MTMSSAGVKNGVGWVPNQESPLSTKGHRTKVIKERKVVMESAAYRRK
jgi:hypothetical protein